MQIDPSPHPDETPLFGLSQRLLPTNLPAEQALLGAIFANNKAYDYVSDFLRPEHFADPIHGRIYQACQERIDGGQKADAVILKGEFENAGVLDEVGGTAYLTQLLTAMVGIINAGDYGRAIHDSFQRRRLIAFGESVVNNAFITSTGLDARAQIEAAEQQLFTLGGEDGEASRSGATLDDGLTLATESAERAYKNQGKLQGVTTGLADLDHHLGGLHDTDLLIVAGRPGMGKTALAMKIAYAAAWQVSPAGGRIGVLSMEMSTEQLSQRILAEQSKVSVERMRRGDVTQRDIDHFVEISRRLRGLRMAIDDQPGLTIAKVRNRARRWQRAGGLSLLIVDYLQLMAGSSTGENRTQQISEITRGLKGIAKELGVPVIALSQLSREVERRDDKRPMLADLRESGSIEQDADVVMFLYREEYYLQSREPKKNPLKPDQEYSDNFVAWQSALEKSRNKADIIIAKNRHGACLTIPVFFDGELTRFDNLARDNQESPR